MASHFCKDRCFLPRRPPPDSPTPSHLPAEGAGLEPGELQRRHPGDSSNPQTLPDFSASLHPCGKKSPPSPRATSRRDSPAETLGRREYPLQTTPPLRLCAPAGKNPRPHRVPPPDGILPQRRWDAGNTHSRQSPLCAPAGDFPAPKSRARSSQSPVSKRQLDGVSLHPTNRWGVQVPRFKFQGRWGVLVLLLVLEPMNPLSRRVSFSRSSTSTKRAQLET